MIKEILKVAAPIVIGAVVDKINGTGSMFQTPNEGPSVRMIKKLPKVIDTFTDYDDDEEIDYRPEPRVIYRTVYADDPFMAAKNKKYAWMA